MEYSAFLILFPIIWVVSSTTWRPSRVDTHTITVDADVIIAEVNPLLFGQNFGPWMNKTEDFIKIYKDAGVTLFRFPAGNWGDENQIFPNMLDDLHLVADALGAEVVIQTRSWRDGTAEKAAELVRYSNVENSYGFKFWEVGNEPDLYQNRPSKKTDPIFDINWYNTQFRAYAEAMKAVDPTIKIVGPAVTGDWQEWIPAFFEANGDIVDVVSWHWYPDGHEMSPEDALATPSDIQWQVNTIRAWWVDPKINPKGYQRPVPPLFLGEYSITWASGLRIPLGTQVGALWAAETLGQMANIGVEMGAHFSLMGGPGGTRWHGLVDPLKDYRPVFGVFQIFKDWGNTQLQVDTTAPELIPAFASLQYDGSLAILILNKDLNHPQSVRVNIRGYPNEGEVNILQVVEGIPETVALEPIHLATELSYSLPPASITLFVFPPASPNIFSFILGGIVALLIIGSIYLNLKTKFGETK